jgi:hypothetical protein
MKEGDIVVCVVISTHETYKGHKMHLTFGKAYEVINQQPFQINEQMYQIIDDNGRKSWFDREVVIPLDEWRKKQLKEIGI